ncbi:MAG: tetratricopeptide repeat protein [Myxococcales bacterium]|nr:tetratricopeptide repeat protein [Myxococcales bacterium]
MRRAFLGAVTIFVAGVLAGPALADSTLVERAFTRGNERYLQGDYPGAIDEYRSAGPASEGSAALSFNLGNAYLKAGEVARAIASYERARSLAPRDPDVAYNLTHAKELIGRTYGDEILRQNEEIAATFDSPLARLTSGEITAAFAALYLPFGALLVAWALTRSRLLGRAALGFGAAALATGLALAAHHYLYDRVARAVLVGGVVDIKSGPDDRYTTTFTVHEGLLVRVEEGRGDWYRVQLANGLVGWVPESRMAWVRRPVG